MIVVVFVCIILILMSETLVVSTVIRMVAILLFCSVAFLPGTVFVLTIILDILMIVLVDLLQLVPKLSHHHHCAGTCNQCQAFWAAFWRLLADGQWAGAPGDDRWCGRILGLSACREHPVLLPNGARAGDLPALRPWHGRWSASRASRWRAVGARPRR